MTNLDRKTVTHLEELPNVGKALADDLRLIGIDEPNKLVGKNPFELYDTLCRTSGTHHDPCVIDVFMSIVHFMESGESRPWWSFTDERKRTFLSDGNKSLG